MRSGQAKSFSGTGLVKLNGAVLCKFFQLNNCHQQSSDHCVRPTGTLKHLCAALKSDGSLCAGKHSKLDHK